ncbi:MAG: tRNA preQ1(34) S-adenosylmethionine ribosyltransferase-isomerase QueA [Lentisphaeria bacterium]|nr:tRNA preQ1(34) S-adenosylmethionine ribosyltransferase-isomerase QueA [Lentisphaeria bacterium]
MKLSDFDYDLPPERIAQFPCEPRDASRMLLLRRGSGHCQCGRFTDISSLLRAGDCLVLNDTRVLAARLLGRRQPSGGRIEALLVEAVGPARWHCFLRPGRRLRPGDRIVLDDVPEGGFTVSGRGGDGLFEVLFDTTDVSGLLERSGRIPLPPYIRREPCAADRERYQTVYAVRPGAVAAPTAGLHFTPSVLERLQALGVRVAHVTLHVGPGTFRPVQSERIEEHVMHEEAYELPEETARAVNGTREQGGRVIAVGTTTVRTLETCADPATQRVRPGCGRTRLFLRPPWEPVVCDGLLTNFHLPRSTLLMLVCGFSTVPHVMAAYRLAVREGFRFYSYGDCMLLLPDEEAGCTGPRLARGATANPGPCGPA